MNPQRINVKAPGSSPAPHSGSNQQAKNNNNASQGGKKGKPPVPKHRGSGVQGQVSEEIRAGVQSLRQDRRIVRRQSIRDRRAANVDYKRAIGDLDYVYGETGDYINNMGQQINQGYTDQASRTAAAQQAFVASLQGNSQTVGTGLSTELSRLGLQGVDNSQFAADAQNSINLAGQQGINNQSNIGLQQQGANSISQLLGGMVQGSHISGVGAAVNAKSDAMSEIYSQKREGYNKVAEAISDLKGTRGDLTKQLIQQLGNTGWGRYLAKGQKEQSGGSSYSPGGSSHSGSYSPGGKGKPTPGVKNNSLAELLLGALNGPR